MIDYLLHLLLHIGFLAVLVALALLLNISLEATEFLVGLFVFIAVLSIVGRAALLDARRRHHRR
jgi:hypothetical protein